MPRERGIHAAAYALVHGAATTPHDRERHAAFLAHMLLLAFAALAVAPLFLAFRGAPAPAESVLFALSLAPAAAAMVVARTGRLALGHLVAVAGLAGIALVLVVGVRAGPGAAIAWLVAAQIEATASLDRRVAGTGALACGVVALLVVASAFDPKFAPAVTAGPTALLAGLAVVASTSAARRLATATLLLDLTEASRQARGRTLNAMLDAVVVGLDPAGCVQSLSKPEASFLAMPDHAILGRGLFDQVLVADRPAFLTLIDNAANTGRTEVGTFRMRIAGPDADAPGGAARYRAVEMRARRLAEGRTDLGDGDVVAILSDAGESDRRNGEVERARVAVDGALRAKDQFLTTMSHELRTPLNSIIGFSELLASRTTRPDEVARQCEFARIINQSGKHLLSVVNAVLDMSKIESGTYSIQPEPFDAVALLDQSVDAVAAKAREGSLRVLRDYPGSLEEMIGDRRALKQALLALLANAIKFTPAQGEVTLAARPQGNALLVSVADTGVGIAARDLERLGDPFFQAQGSTTRPFDGAGLGLALVRGLVGLHGGSIAIESELGAGTRVTIKLPLDCRVVASGPAVITTTALPTRQRSLPLIKDAA